MAHSIEQSLASQLVTRTIVSTDSLEYAEIARQSGADVPFLRPTCLAQDHSTDLEVFQHVLDWLDQHENYRPEICVHLRPTYPIRQVRDIDNAIEILLADPSIDSVRSVSPAPETPFKMWFMDDHNILKPVITSTVPEAYNLPRQQLPRAFLQNASVDVVRTDVIVRKRSMTGSVIRGYVMADFHDIDTEAQFLAAEQSPLNTMSRVADAAAVIREKLSKNEVPVICLDIDGVIAAIVPDLDYGRAAPIREMIDAVNRLYDLGCRIVLHTARGSSTGHDWSSITSAR